MAMNRKVRAMLLGALTISISGTQAYAQTPPKASGSGRKSFEEFRKGILSDYKDFRQTLLDRYADFLNGEWHEYESFNGVRRDSKPKPQTVPRAEPSGSRTKPETDTAPVISEPASPASKTSPLPETARKNGGRITPRPDGKDEFSFYGLPVQMPRVDFNITRKLYSNADYAGQWRDLQKADVAARLLPHIKSLASEMGLNDYLTYRLINSYIDSRFNDADATSRMSAVHYLLASLGYDVRIAITGQGVPLLLIPFRQTIYARTYMMVEGEKYYVFEPEGFSLAKAGPQNIMTCRLPDNLDRGRKMDLILGELHLPYSPKAFEFECGPIHLKGEVNENLMPVLYNYPQMPVSDFAASNLQPELRHRLVSQMRSQLDGLEGDEKVARLLTFMHSVFSYATDEEFHGFEKPYFLEETLYYPKNDCEDRAIFYTWFLWHALGREAQLVSFPGHEAATVRLDNPVEGTGYDYQGTRYYISDPTFIGSKTGMIMPVYKDTPPNIDCTFK
ncbi:MAG: hypothetical protein K2I45_00735 [Muribaculaceae bacterium]|nr:hypothetical protein [Muribaculaceae bacterium]